MHRQHERVNIPPEILRAAVKIAETESITKAAHLLGLSQPAISAQLKRIEAIVGGRIFQRTGSGSIPTELGKLVLTHARKILEGNEQLLRLRGSADNRRTIRLGISTQYVETALLGRMRRNLPDATVHAGPSTEITKELLDRHLDAGLLLVSSDLMVSPAMRVINQRHEELTWVRSHKFVLSPGSPIPLAIGTGQTTDDAMIRALQKAGLAYRVALTGHDHHATMIAVESGYALTVLPKSIVPPSLVCARDYYLPPLESAKLFLCATEEMDAQDCPILGDLNQQFFEAPAPN
ncbi:LysR family transcriptional regulator [Bradyrhizobium sp.]|jgi:DNA-binding transcriptional LysR family regulator|uniref:LysR family transcriptional regulator n=1 Tax=Bradyrhizobium sp. TaxID=376 RepID=UPI003C1A7873